MVFEAARQAEARGVLTTTRSTAEIREQIDAELRVRSVFVARATNVMFLSQVKAVTTAIAEGEMDKATGRWILLETLRAQGYTPEGGFPEVPAGLVPPAVRGSIEDLSSQRRLNLILDTQLDLMRGLAAKAKGSTPRSMRLYPAWELIRIYDRREKRDWPARWVIAGGALGGKMIALKGDPIWGELGSSANFDDGLDVDFPPFAFGSGMGWRPVTRAEVRALGVSASSGETMEEWFAEARPVLGGLQEPVVSVRQAAPEIVKAFVEKTGAAVAEGQATTAAGKDELLRKLAERRAARAAARAADMREALAR